MSNALDFPKDKPIMNIEVKDGEELVGSRAPHTTMGNVLYAKNKKLPEVEKYFNLSKEVFARPLARLK